MSARVVGRTGFLGERNEWGHHVEYKQKRQIVESLLDHWEDFFSVADTTARPVIATDTDGAGIPVLSALSRHPSVVELARCLEVCRRMAPGTYKHIRARYQSETRLVQQPTRRRDARGRMVADVERVRVPVVPSWVFWEMSDPAWTDEQRERLNLQRHHRMVDRGTDFLVGVFNGAPELPLALTRKLRPLADADGWTEAA